MERIAKNQSMVHIGGRDEAAYRLVAVQPKRQPGEGRALAQGWRRGHTSLR